MAEGTTLAGVLKRTGAVNAAPTNKGFMGLAPFGADGYNSVQWVPGQRTIEQGGYDSSWQSGDGGGGGYFNDGFDNGRVTPKTMAALGYTPPPGYDPWMQDTSSSMGGGDSGATDYQVDPAFTASQAAGAGHTFADFLKEQGITSKVGRGEKGYQQYFYDKNGNPLYADQWATDPDDAFGAAMLAAGTLISGGLAAGAWGPGAAGASAASGVGGTAATGLGGDVAGLTSLDSAAYAGAGDSFLTPGIAAGGAGGAGGATVASDPFSAYLLNGASDYSTVGGLGGYAGAVGEGALPEVLSSAIPGSSTSWNLQNLLKNYLGPAQQVGKALTGSGAQGAGSGLFGGSGNPGVGAALAALLAGSASGGSSNVNTPNYNGAANSAAQSARTNQTTPWGSSTWTQTGTDAQGNPIWSQNTSLNAQGQSNLDAAQKAQGTAINALGQDQSAQIQQAQDAAYHKQTALLDPQYQQGQERLDQQLANQGIGIGSEAYNNATGNFARQKDYAYGNARDSAIGIGDQMQGQLFGQNLTAATGLNGAVQAPNFQATPQPTNYLGAAALQGQGNLNQYNANTGAKNSFNSGLFNLGGSILSNPNWTGLLGGLFSNNGQTPSTNSTQGP